MTRHNIIIVGLVLIISILIGLLILVTWPTGQSPAGEQRTPDQASTAPTELPAPTSDPTQPGETEEDVTDTFDNDPSLGRLDDIHWVVESQPNPERIAQAEAAYAAWIADLPQDQWWPQFAKHLSANAQTLFAPLQREFQTAEPPTGPAIQRSQTETGPGIVQVAIPVENGSWIITLWEQTPGKWVVDNLEPAIAINQLTQ